ncbi:MAG TPA: glycerophosphodiester phosphodiesterase family protein [Candidatus Angelobacter sp.]
MLRIGPRGASGHAPENTLKAIEAGIAAQSDFVELDVQRTRDNNLVIMHDKRVDRTTNGTGLVSDLTLKELKSLDAGAGERIPTVEEVLHVAHGRVGLMLEIITPGIGAELYELVRRSRFPGPLIYASFLHAELLKVNHANRLALLEAIPVDPTAFALDAKATYAGLSIDSITPAFVADLHKTKLTVFVYTVNDPRDIECMRSIGVDGAISDYPELIPKSELISRLAH